MPMLRKKRKSSMAKRAAMRKKIMMRKVVMKKKVVMTTATMAKRKVRRKRNGLLRTSSSLAPPRIVSSVQARPCAESTQRSRSRAS